ncbi:MAG: di-heme-cytochrome C peroxidase [Vicinamibacterales bacterium]
MATPVLTSRLAHGLYAHPGVYPATIRFANASTSVCPDSSHDVRGMSFSVEIPSGLLTRGGGSEAPVTRLDYTLNSWPTFPINDAHAFATFTRVMNAGGHLAALRAVWSLPFRDLFGFLATAVRGRQELRQAVAAYQTRRYWSTVPFRNGPDEVIKYSAIPHPENHAQPLGDGPECLRDELVRHVDHDRQMSTWDIGLQLLEPSMTRFGVTRQPSFWVENASVEWPESQSPFHIVGRLRLLPHAVLSDAEAAPLYVDVSEHSIADNRPIGSINRARWAAEAASRRARLDGATTIQPAVPLTVSPVSRLAHWALAAIVAMVAGYAAFGWWYMRGVAAYLPPVEQVDDIRYLDQGWGDAPQSPERQAYYHTAQGASMHRLRYSWFINVERPFRTQRFADPVHLQQLRFILDAAPTTANPDHLPVGFTQHFDDQLQDTVVDITCAACHTGQLHVTRNGHTVAIRVDGGQAMNGFTDFARGSFQVELVAAFGDTLANPIKFNRFATRVLGDASSWRNKARLYREVAGVLADIARVGTGSSYWKRYPTTEGFGRTDALARIGNVVFGDHVDARNYKIGNGPVNFPYLWDIWKFDWVQYNASVSQPMARNVGEALGTGATFQLLDRYGRPIPEDQRYWSSIDIGNLQRIETLLQRLEPPVWPEDCSDRLT